MSFGAFAASHGLIVDRIVPGKWVRVPTEDKPRRRNGAYKFLGAVGWVQNHATMAEPEQWVDGAITDYAVISRAINVANSKRAAEQEVAAKRAEKIMREALISTHPYLQRKGLDVMAPVWRDLLAVPMRVDGRLVGVQLIAEDGTKRFLTGQRCDRAVFAMGRGSVVLCEGYATAMSVQSAFMALGRARTVIATFSAGNLVKVAARHSGASIVADSDASGTGERAAKATGLRYWMPPEVGMDFNDFLLARGKFAASQAIRGL